ncbi:Uncharacterised protein [Peptostreptococcus anaerobius]|uniref:Phage minor structural protein GP20 n=1 Tax=Peptostreptococcus anaerobius TaxID=1261 RepID=A0A379CEZ9_9FIRM|nr:hypothetical protein [Peptostreptococcus anaerobius]EKX89284.1 hypothetical protein HMPREF9998_01719 [Peptostreptococcus anaerobius VPI 4330 = DSM 2949]SFM69616.1 hypothetical protein SAMN05660467_00205 [Peptostreptococcus anaerobius]SUB61032.1 Uncharacterised protein [Peptostreptococcus anaerobius]
MKREFLKELGLEDDVIGKIMKEHGKSIQKLDDAIETYRGKISDLQTDIATKDKAYEDLNKELTVSKAKVEDFEKLDVEGLKKSVQDWENKYNEREYDLSVDKYMQGYKFTSDLAKEATISKFKEQKFKLKDGKLDGAEDFMKKFIEENKSAFVVEGEGNNNASNGISNGPAPYKYVPAGGSSAEDIKDFESMLDSMI